ncbi:hypothetical protein ARC272_22025, partial [Pantoea ananatis]
MRCKADCVKNADEVGLFHLTPDISMRFSIWCFMNKKKVKKKRSSDIQRSDAAAPCFNDDGNKT